MKGHICNDCQYRHHGRYKQPADSGSQSVFCLACGHYNIGSTLEYTVGHWDRIVSSMPKQQSHGLGKGGE